MIDLLVVGGGPVGLATALAATRAGLQVTVAEPRTGPIDKACGEGLMPAALTALRRLGLPELPGRPFAGLRYLDGHRAVDARFRHGPGRGVRRLALSNALRAATEAAGVRIAPLRIDRLEQTADFVRGGEVRARYAVVADGVHSLLARRLGLVRPRSGIRRWGLRAHFAVAPWTELVEVYVGPAVEAYVTPVADDLVGVAVMSARRGGFDEQLAGVPGLRDRLAGLSHGQVLGAGPLRHTTTRRVTGRILLAGDAAGYVDSLTGEGLAVGFAGAIEMARSLAVDRAADWERDWRLLTRPSRLLTTGLLWATTHRTRRYLVPASAAAPAVFGTVVRTLGGR